MTDILIIGGGVIGMLCARELRLAGAGVTLVERAGTGQEASWAAGGILSPLYPWQVPAAITLLAQWGQQQYRALARDLLEETGIDAGWIRSGLLVLDAEETVPAQTWAARAGEELITLGSEKLKSLEPVLATGYKSALWLPEVAQIRSPRLMQALRRSLVMRGVDIREDTTVTGLDTRPARGVAGHSRIVAVATSEGRLQADTVVLAGGAWNARLLADTGLKLPVRPVRGQMLLFKAKPGLVSHIILAQQRYLVPRSDGRILAGSTLEEVGFDKTTTESALKELQTAAIKLAPDLADYPVERQWAGLRPGSPQGIPSIGAHPRIAGLFVNAGHFRNGIVLAPASARLLADIVLGRNPVVDPRPYHVAAVGD